MNRHVRNFPPGDGTASWAFPELDALAYARSHRGTSSWHPAGRDPGGSDPRPAEPFSSALQSGGGHHPRITRLHEIPKIGARIRGRLAKSSAFRESCFISRAMRSTVSPLPLLLSRKLSAVEKYIGYPSRAIARSRASLLILYPGLRAYSRRGALSNLFTKMTHDSPAGFACGPRRACISANSRKSRGTERDQITRRHLRAVETRARKNK